MSGASDKARFFIEQSIPELQELGKKKLFRKEEITSIAKKRSDFEHKLNARGSLPLDYARYIEYEMNLDSLKRKRARRLRVKEDGHASQRRIFFLLNRATRKFHGDIGLWMLYLEFATKRKAHKIVIEKLTSLLRMHPTKSELWIYAAKYSLDAQGDVIEARSYMQQGLRFCKSSKTLWLEYAKLEMIYIAKLSAQQQIIGLEKERLKAASPVAIQGLDADQIALSGIYTDLIDPSSRTEHEADQSVPDTLQDTPVMKGAIPITVFDAAMREFEDVSFGEQFFDMVCQFVGVRCITIILDHITTSLVSLDPDSPASLFCTIRQPLIGIEPTSPHFPKALSASVRNMKSAVESQPSIALITRIIGWLAPYLQTKNLDPDIQQVINALLIRNMGRYKAIVQKESGGNVAQLLSTLETLQSHRDLENLVMSSLEWSSEIWPTEPRLSALRDKILQANTGSS